ncbi:uncharacterized protein LOC129572036 [Sitodiplosis mosellana]|uniref:uncharacterized protein LOC129572036 n=1 Tax=Sitodiplosis mosellana TaxID=263140 RepID=UPI0024447988|nr:uncharacterized protein LOC129572036 [Sitodiplosis mosellana]
MKKERDEYRERCEQLEIQLGKCSITPAVVQCSSAPEMTSPEKSVECNDFEMDVSLGDASCSNGKSRSEAVSMILDLIGSFKEKGATVDALKGTYLAVYTQPIEWQYVVELIAFGQIKIHFETGALYLTGFFKSS